MMSLWDALRMNMMISYQELVRTFPSSDLHGLNKLEQKVFSKKTDNPKLDCQCFYGLKMY